MRTRPTNLLLLMIYDLFHISLTLISFTGTKEPTIDLLPTSVAKIAQLVEHRTGIGFKVLGEVLNFFQASLRNCINCVHCDDHFFISICY